MILDKPVVSDSLTAPEANDSAIIPIQEASIITCDLVTDVSVSGTVDQNILDKHVFTQSKNSVCSTCGKIFTQKRSLLRHCRFIHNTHDQGQKCVVCGKSFRCKSDLQRHCDSQHRSITYDCVECGKRYKTKGGLRSHQQAHREEYKFICAYCGRMFMYKSHYDGHISKHTNIKLYKCDKCGTSFSHISNMKQHEKICGLSEKPLQCSVCPSMFKAKRYLVQHMKSHESPQSHQCPYCGKIYPHRGLLKHHVDAKHSS